MSTDPRPGDVIRVSYETTVPTDMRWRGHAFTHEAEDCRNVTVEVIGLADDPAQDLVGTVRMTPNGPAVKSNVAPGESPWLMITQPMKGLRVDAYLSGGMRHAPIIGVVPGSPAAEKASEDFANDETMALPCGTHWVSTGPCSYRAGRALHRCGLDNGHAVPTVNGRLEHRCVCGEYLT